MTSGELVQEIYHMLMDREDSCHRTCFSLQLNGQTLDNFTELKTIEGLKEGSVLKVVEGMMTAMYNRVVQLSFALAVQLMCTTAHSYTLVAVNKSDCLLPEPYTAREARLHVRHVRDLLKSVDQRDAYDGIECASLSFLSTLAGNVLGIWVIYSLHI